MEIYKPMSSKELSQRKIEEYTKMANLVQWGRKNPVKFCELAFGLKLIDYQSYCFMKIRWIIFFFRFCFMRIPSSFYTSHCLSNIFFII